MESDIDGEEMYICFVFFSINAITTGVTYM